MSSELLYKGNRPQVSMVYRHDKPLGMSEEHPKLFSCSSNILLGLSAYKALKIVVYRVNINNLFKGGVHLPVHSVKQSKVVKEKKKLFCWLG